MQLSAVLPGNPCGVPPGSVVQLLTSEFQRGWIQGVLSVDGLSVGGYRVSSVWMDSAWVDTGCPQRGWTQGVLSVGGYRVSSAWVGTGCPQRGCPDCYL